MYTILGISSFTSKKNGKSYLSLHCQSVNPMPSSRGSGYEVLQQLVSVDDVNFDCSSLSIGDIVTFFFNKSGFLTLIQKYE